MKLVSRGGGGGKSSSSNTIADFQGDRHLSREESECTSLHLNETEHEIINHSFALQ